MARKTEPAEPAKEAMPQTGGSFVRQADGTLVEAEPPTQAGARSLKPPKDDQPIAEVSDGTA